MNETRDCYTERSQSDRGKKSILYYYIYMESRKMVLTGPVAGQEWKQKHREWILDTAREGEDGTN